MPRYRVVKVSDVESIDLPGHKNMLIRKIVSPKGAIEDDRIDFGVTIYEPNAHVEEDVHEETHHIFYLITGRLTGLLDGEKRIFEGGEVIYIPPGVRHEFTNEEKEPATLVAVLYPPKT